MELDQALKADTPQGDQDETTEAPRRRSARLGNRVANGVSTSESPAAMSEARRNPKRKAAEASNHLNNLPDNLLEEALAPLSITDIEEWEGWIELESEPVSFITKDNLRRFMKT